MGLGQRPPGQLDLAQGQRRHDLGIAWRHLVGALEVAERPPGLGATLPLLAEAEEPLGVVAQRRPVDVEAQPVDGGRDRRAARDQHGEGVVTVGQGEGAEVDDGLHLVFLGQGPRLAVAAAIELQLHGRLVARRDGGGQLDPVVGGLRDTQPENQAGELLRAHLAPRAGARLLHHLGPLAGVVRLGLDRARDQDGHGAGERLAGKVAGAAEEVVLVLAPRASGQRQGQAEQRGTTGHDPDSVTRPGARGGAAFFAAFFAT